MKWRVVCLLIGLCLWLPVGLNSCIAPQPLRRDIAQANYEDKKGLEHLEQAFVEAVELRDSALLQGVKRRLERAIKLLTEAEKGFPPKDFTPTDDTFDQVYSDMAKLRKQMDALRHMLEGVKGLITKLGEAGKVVTGIASGGFSVLSPQGGIMGVLIAAVIAAVTKALTEKLKRKKSDALFGLVAEQVGEQQMRSPGSQDPLLNAIAEKATKTGLYNNLEAKLDKQGYKTTRKSRHNGTPVSS